MDFRRTYRAAAVSYADLVSRLPVDSDVTFGEWSLRSLVGHTVSSAIRQVPDALAAPPAEIAVDSPEGYWALARSAPASLIESARAASDADALSTGKQLGDDPAATVGELIGRATSALAAAGDDDVVATPVGGMRVRDWLPTRTLELVVHGLDAADAAGVPFEPPAAAVAETAALLAKVAAAVGDGPAVVRALTGRGPLPQNFSVVV
jgi:Mycothiol maleylpyruvate isomerase N-terminal domain